MGWVYGRILGEVGGSFVVTLDLKLEMAPMLDLGIIFGVGIRPLRMPSQFHLDLGTTCVNDASIKWNFLEVPFSET
jgi:hypothetical protein